MPEFASFVPTAEQYARLQVALRQVLPYAESRFEDLCISAEEGPEDPDSPGVADIVQYIESAKELTSAYAPAAWRPETGDWVYYDSRENSKDNGLARVMSYNPTTEITTIEWEGMGQVQAHMEEISFLSRPGPSERGDVINIALGNPGDSANETDYVLEVPEGSKRGNVWLKAGGVALCISKRDDDLVVKAFPNGDEMSEPWQEMHIDDAFAPDAPSMKP
ncbi:hypothetical protein LJR168_003762 [Pseudoxanthomonas sp. LjRoot168]|uniref:hypothetical protein n=1 Tax=unclassified Pseudoxanthomonas TaxID=2645906 RepID=UPI003ECD1354